MCKLLFLFLIVFINITNAQEVFNIPDYSQIENEISDASSKFFYPNLLNRFMNCDTNLTIEDCFYIYYGYACQEGYDPNYRNDSVPHFRQIFNKKELTNEDYKYLANVGNAILESDPTNLKIMILMAYLHEIFDNHDLAWKHGMRNAKMIEAIFSTGDGKSEDSAIYVISTEHEYWLLELMDAQFIEQSLVQYENQMIDAMKVAYDNEIKVVYFNVTQLFVDRRKIHKE